MSRAGEVHRQLADALDDLAMWRTLVALLPWTVYVDHDLERALSRIPQQRDQQAPAETPAKSDAARGTRST